MTLATANIWTAVDYINDSFPRDDGVPVGLVRWLGLQENQPGHITFRVYRSRTVRFDTLGRILKRVKPVLGEKYVRTCTQDTETYEWRLTPTRSLIVWYKKRVGTFIQLRDDGLYSGVML